ncbi:MAG: hypothetical protein AAB917_02505 [Patescibacteria group bacterium]
MKNKEKTRARVEQLLMCLKCELSCLQESRRQTNFMRALIARSLYSAREFDVAKEISTKLIDELLKEKSPNWTWNYHSSNQKGTYPDDLDDTFCSLHALCLWRKETITGNVLACMTKILLKNEISTGGPYATWIISDKKWDDIDPWVNANIAAFLGENKILLPGLNAYLDSNINGGSSQSKYYLSDASLYYFLSFWYKDSVKKIRSVLSKKQKADGSFENLLSTALSMCALIRLGGDADCIKMAADYISKNSSEIKKDPFFVEKIENGKIIYADTKAVTMSFCIEALCLYLQSWHKTEVKTSEMDHIKNTYRCLSKKLDEFDLKISKQAKKHIFNFLKKDINNEIILLPYLAYRNLDKNKIPGGPNLKNALSLSIANIFGWYAYSIYDKCVDSQNGDYTLLPFANMHSREMHLIYGDLLPNKILLKMILNRADHAYWFEKTYLCEGTYAEKIPNKVIYGKSLGHALPVITLLAMQGRGNTSREIRCVLGFFKEYLLVRQLSDDAHDWKEDIENKVTTQITQQIDSIQKNTGAAYSREQIFWERVSIYTARRILHHINNAERHIETLKGVFEKTDFLTNLIAPYRKIAEDIIREHSLMIEFIKEMSKKN